MLEFRYQPKCEAGHQQQEEHMENKVPDFSTSLPPATRKIQKYQVGKQVYREDLEKSELCLTHLKVFLKRLSW